MQIDAWSCVCSRIPTSNSFYFFRASWGPTPQSTMMLILSFSITMVLYYITLLVLAFLVFWLITSAIFTSCLPPPPELRNKNIVLLIGHPDDEAMFFGPSLIALASPKNGNSVKIICLSNGNAVGQGKIREGELLNSARRLGIRSDDDIDVKDNPQFQDGPSDWKKEDISDYLAQSFALQEVSNLAVSTSTSTLEQRPERRSEHRQSQVPDSKATSASSSTNVPDAIVTFDPHGISTHPNHCSCYYGATHFITHFNHQHTSPIALYTLTSIPILRKYLSILDAPISLLLSSFQSTSAPTTRNRIADTEKTDTVLFVSGFRDYARAFGAMVLAHKTQMLWFRWGWIITGRYMVVNDLRRESIPV